MVGIDDVLVGLLTGGASSYLVTTLIQWKHDKDAHFTAKKRLSSYLQRIFDELAVIQQRQELQEENNGPWDVAFDFGTLIHLLALSPEYISVNHVAGEGKQLLIEISNFLEEIYISCFEYNMCNKLESKAVVVLNDYQNRTISYSKKVLDIAYKKKWWIPF